MKTSDSKKGGPTTEWLEELQHEFPKGRNPWLDVYPEDVVSRVGKIISVDDHDDLAILRYKLTKSAVLIHSTKRMIGGLETPINKKMAREVAQFGQSAPRTVVRR